MCLKIHDKICETKWLGSVKLKILKIREKLRGKNPKKFNHFSIYLTEICITLFKTFLTLRNLG